MSKLTGALLVGVFAACSNVETDQACAPGEQKSCVCADGGQGFQTCNAEGSAFDACTCGTGGAGPTTSSTTTTGAGGGGGSEPCTPGENVPCYTGPAGTEDVGLCQGGIAMCQPDATPGACDGEVLPAQESCVTPEDEDCNGSSPACSEPWSISFAANADFTPSFVETDAAGNIYLAGTFTDSLDFGGGALTGLGTADIFVAKFDAAGGHIWSKRFGEAIDDLFLTGMDVNAAGDIALSGIFYDELDFGSGPITADPSGPFAAVLDTNGDAVWSAAGEGNVQWATPIAFDGQGNVSYGVFYGGSVYFGGSEVHMGSGIAIAKYDAATGTFVSSAGYPGCASAYSTGLDAAPNGNVVFVGKAPYSGTCDWGGGVVPPGAGIAIAGLTIDYSHVFSNVFPGVNVDVPVYAAYGANGEIALTVMSAGPVDFDGNIVTSSGGVTGLIAVLEPTSEFRFAKYFEGTAGVGARLGRPRFSSSLGQVAVHGTLVSPTTIGASEVTPVGIRDSVLIHLSTTGAVLTATQYGATSTTTDAYTMAVHPTGSFILAGRYVGNTSGSQGPDFGQGNLPGGTEVRGFLANVAPR